MQSGIYDKFLARYKERMAAVNVGDPFDSNNFQGPQVSQLQYDRIMSYIKTGKEEGATVQIGGERHGTQGYYIQPTIFSDVKPDMTIMKEEIFGPVIAMAKFETEEEVIQLANDTMYGLAAGVHTKDLNTAIRVSNELRAGTVWINRYVNLETQTQKTGSADHDSYNMLSHQVPFGGYKQSGIGRELGEAALENYTQHKSVHVRLAGPLF